MASPISPLPSSELSRKYTFGDSIGEGQYGKVWCCMDRETGNLMACKQIRTADLSESGREDMHREVRSMAALQGHENVLHLAEIYADDTAMYLVTELCDCGDLFDLISRSKGGMSEAVAAAIFVQIARALEWCHAHRIVHRDIKPENVLLASSRDAQGNPHASVRLADFGLSFQLAPDCAMIGVGGSAPYEAPEVLAEQSYDTQADVWSLGVLLFTMLSSTWPSFHGNKRELVRCDFAGPRWPQVSVEAKDLIRRMMTVDQNRRIDMRGVLAHPWLAGYAAPLNAPAARAALASPCAPVLAPSAVAPQQAAPPAESARSCSPRPPSTPRSPLQMALLSRRCRLQAQQQQQNQQLLEHAAACNTNANPEQPKKDCHDSTPPTLIAAAADEHESSSSPSALCPPTLMVTSNSSSSASSSSSYQTAMSTSLDSDGASPATSPDSTKIRFRILPRRPSLLGLFSA